MSEQLHTTTRQHISGDAGAVDGPCRQPLACWLDDFLHRNGYVTNTGGRTDVR